MAAVLASVAARGFEVVTAAGSYQKFDIVVDEADVPAAVGEIAFAAVVSVEVGGTAAGPCSLDETEAVTTGASAVGVTGEVCPSPPALLGAPSVAIG
jgi:hypothetical protein